MAARVDSDSSELEFRMQAHIKPNVLKQVTEMVMLGILQPLDQSLMSALFWETDGDGITTKRFSRNSLAKLLNTTAWLVRRALRRLESVGLLARADRPYKGKGTIWKVVGKAIYKKIKQRESQRKQHRAQKRRGKRSYARLEGQTVRRTVKKAAPPKPAPVFVEPELSDEEKRSMAEFEQAREAGGTGGVLALLKKKLRGG